jgi:hypothetical protein
MKHRFRRLFCEQVKLNRDRFPEGSHVPVDFGGKSISSDFKVANCDLEAWTESQVCSFQRREIKTKIAALDGSGSISVQLLILHAKPDKLGPE